MAQASTAVAAASPLPPLPSAVEPLPPASAAVPVADVVAASGGKRRQLLRLWRSSRPRRGLRSFGSNSRRVQPIAGGLRGREHDSRRERITRRDKPASSTPTSTRGTTRRLPGTGRRARAGGSGGRGLDSVGVRRWGGGEEGKVWGGSPGIRGPESYYLWSACTAACLSGCCCGSHRVITNCAAGHFHPLLSSS